MFGAGIPEIGSILVIVAGAVLAVLGVLVPLFVLQIRNSLIRLEKRVEAWAEFFADRLEPK